MFPSKQIHLQFFSENFHRFWTRKESQGAFTVHSSRFLAKGASSQLRKMKALWLSWDRNFRRSSCFFSPKKQKHRKWKWPARNIWRKKEMISVTCDVCSAGKCFTRLHMVFFSHMSVENGHRHRDIVTTLRFAFSAGITKSMGRLCLSKGKFLQVELSIFRWKLHDGHGSSKIKNLHKNTQIFWSQDQKTKFKKK